MVRTIAFVVVSIAMFTNLCALIWVKAEGSGPQKLQLKVVVDKPDLMAKAKAQMEGAGLTVTVTPGEKMERNVTDGYRVVLTSANPDELKPILKTLQHDKFPAKMIGNEIQVGPVYKTEKQAKVQQVKVAAYGLKVAEHQKKAMVKVFQLTAEVEGQEKVAEIQTALGGLGVAAEDVISTTPTPAP